MQTYKDAIKLINLKLNDWEAETIDKYLPFFKDSVFFDIGSNVGIWSLAALINGAKMVVAFEPNEVYFSGMKLDLNKSELKMDKKLNINGFTDNMRLLKNADGKWLIILKMVTSEEYINEGGYKTTIDRFMSSSDILTLYAGTPKVPGPPTIMKIDTEGMELSVLKGAEKTIKQYRPKLMVETHDFMHPGRKDEVVSLLREWGYNEPDILYMPDEKSYGYHLRYL